MKNPFRIKYNINYITSRLSSEDSLDVQRYEKIKKRLRNKTFTLSAAASFLIIIAVCYGYYVHAVVLACILPLAVLSSYVVFINKVFLYSFGHKAVAKLGAQKVSKFSFFRHISTKCIYKDMHGFNHSSDIVIFEKDFPEISGNDEIGIIYTPEVDGLIGLESHSEEYSMRSGV